MKEVIDFIKRVQAVSQTGLSFSTDPYALENYEELNKLSIEMLSKVSDLPLENAELYGHYMYPVPQPAVRVLVMNELGQVLMVREVEGGKWSIPGGWCDIGESPSESAIKEVKQESGYDVELDRLLAIFDRNKYIDHVSRFDVYSIFFSAKVIGGEINPCHEIIEVGWFDLDNLPVLSRKLAIEELETSYDVCRNKKPTYFD